MRAIFGPQPTAGDHRLFDLLEVLSYQRDLSRDEAHFVKKFQKLSTPKRGK